MTKQSQAYIIEQLKSADPSGVNRRVRILVTSNVLWGSILVLSPSPPLQDSCQTSSEVCQAHLAMPVAYNSGIQVDILTEVL